MAADVETIYYECDTGAPDWGARPGHVLFLVRRPGVWLAIHAPRESSLGLDELLKLSIESIVFCCCEDILQPGEHNWLAPP